jgi:hypothetical protein
MTSSGDLQLGSLDLLVAMPRNIDVMLSREGKQYGLPTSYHLGKRYGSESTTLHTGTSDLTAERPSPVA